MIDNPNLKNTAIKNYFLSNTGRKDFVFILFLFSLNSRTK